MVEIALGRAAGEVEDSAVEETWEKVGLILRSSSNDTPLYDSTGDTALVDEEGTLSIVIEVTDEGLFATHGEEPYAIGTISDGINLFVENRGEKGELEIKSVLIFKNRTQSDTETSKETY